MKKQYYQSQYILNKVYNNTNNIIRTTLNTSQDYLNAVYDNNKDALRVNIDGGALPVVPSVNELPLTAGDGQICPVLNAEKGCLDFYEWDIEIGEWKYRGSTVKPDSLLKPEEQIALSWTTQHLNQIKEVADFDYIVHVDTITLPSDSNIIEVQGNLQNIDDDLNGDNDSTTPYRIDVTGYVMSVSTYANNDSIVPDRYYTRITYESTGGGLGVSHIYMQQDEYNHFASLEEGKNILTFHYLTNSTTSPIKHIRYVMNNDNTVTDADGNIISVFDTNDSDGDVNTICNLICAGYVLGIQTYASSEALIMDKYYTKIVYENDGIHAGKSSIYLNTEEWSYFSNLKNGKNIIDIYYVATVFPASVTISETQYQLPITEVGYVAIDASGNIRNIEDTLNKDGDDNTHIKISVNGYVLDVDGYQQSDDNIKKRLLVKMSYDPIIDITDVYLDKEYYDYASNLVNGKNTISIYTLGAGIGIDASRISNVDSVLDVNSEKAIQNKIVAQAINNLENQIVDLKNQLNELNNN